MDKLDATIMGEVHSLLKMIHPKGTVVNFSSQLCILNDVSEITNLLISNPTLLRFLVVDELLLFTHFGKLFREEFEKLNEGLIVHVCTHSLIVAKSYLCCADYSVIRRTDWDDTYYKKLSIHIEYNKSKCMY